MLGGGNVVDKVMLVTLITGPLTGEIITIDGANLHMLTGCHGRTHVQPDQGRYINSNTNSASSHPIHITVQILYNYLLLATLRHLLIMISKCSVSM